MAYIWGGNTGIKTPEEAARRRKAAETIAANMLGRAPQNIGEGLSAIGQALAARGMSRQAEKAETEGRAAWQSKYGDLLSELMGGGRGAVPPVPGIDEAPGGVVPPAPDLSQANPEYLTGGGMPPPPTMENVANAQLPPPEDLNAIVRTVIGEAGNQSPEGQRAVAEVILNRARETGMTPMQVVSAKGQFEPWATRGAELNAIDPASQQYQSVLGNITPAFAPDDPTGGADYFYAPKAQAALGRDVPDWAQGQQGRDIGDHRFYSLGYGGGLAGAEPPGDVSISSYSPPGDTIPAEGAASAMATGQPIPEPPPIQTAGLSITGSDLPQPEPQQPGVQLAGGAGFDPRIAEALSDPWLPEGQKAVLQAILEQQLKANEPVDYGFTEVGTDIYRTNPRTGKVERVIDNPDESDKPDPEIRRFEYAQKGGFKGTFEEWQKLKNPMVTVNTGDTGSGDKQLRESLGKKEGERWDELQQAGTISGSMAQDFEVLDQLMTVAPQSPLTGPFLEMFPGISTTGAAFQSIVKRIAPSLRTPGSGSTSDIEYDGMLQSLPRLGNYPEANQLIAEVMKGKAALNVERSDVIMQYQNDEISAKDARRKLSELNKRSILSPKMKSLLNAQQDTKASPNDPAGTEYKSIDAIPDGQFVEDSETGKKYQVKDGKLVPVL